MDKKKFDILFKSHYKIGDNITIKDKETILREKEKDYYDKLSGFVEPMEKYCNEKAKIIEVISFDTYLIDIDNKTWYWTGKMFK